MFNQISEYFDSFFSKFQCEFRNGYSALHCPLLNGSQMLTETTFGALFTDLSKAFDCLLHELLNAHGFSFKTFKIVQDYLLDRKQRIKVNLTFSPFKEFLFEFAQG